jgi:hypothetical protein
MNVGRYVRSASARRWLLFPDQQIKMFLIVEPLQRGDTLVEVIINGVRCAEGSAVKFESNPASHFQDLDANPVKRSACEF